MSKLKLQLLLARVVQQSKIPSCFRDIDNNAEANSSRQLRGLLSDITSESAQSLGAQRHYLFQKKAAAEMMRRDTRNPEVVYQLRK